MHLEKFMKDCLSTRHSPEVRPITIDGIGPPLND
jgi:hypothetical protein